jgi:hypothetical protein
VGALCLAARALLFLRADLPLPLRILVTFVSALPTVMAAALLLLWLRGQLTPLRSALLAMGIGAILALDLATGSVAPAVMSMSLLVFVYMRERQALPLRALLLAALVVVPSLGIKQRYRAIVHKHPEMGVTDRAQLFGSLVAGVFVGGNPEMARAADVAENRVAHLSNFAFVVAKTPETVPYWNGDSYANFWWSFVPRVLYPEKPEKTLGQEFGHRYRIIGPADRGTSVNLEQLVEMYANFGPAGVLVGMFLLGLLYRALYAVLNHPDGGDGGTLVAASVFAFLLNIESDFTLVFGGVVQQAVLLALILFALAGRRRNLAVGSVAQ